MDCKTFKQLEKAISISRLQTYKNSSYLSNEELFGKYIWNVQLSENFYFLLKNLEISLRNSIYDAYTNSYPERSIFHINKEDRYKRKEFHAVGSWKMIKVVKYNLIEEKKEVSDERIISQLNFGFWTKLLLDNHRNYRDMWRQILKDVFPHKPIRYNLDREKKDVAQKLNKIRVFRNRIFHYEPIFNRDDLDNIHKDILNIIGCINPELLTLTKMFDRYEEIVLKEKLIVEQLLEFGEKNESSPQTI